MKESEITAIAREYAEEITKKFRNRFGDLSDWTYYEFRDEAKGKAEEVLTWLLRRYCLVEKSKVQEEYHEANICRTHFERYGAQWGALTAKMAILERFFPDLGKEVEG